MSENMKLWNAVKQPPPSALKQIGGGRLKGMTDIKPQWRYLAITEQYGPCGIGWKYTVEKLWMENGANDQIVAFANILLYIKRDSLLTDSGWSDGIPGNGGSMFVAKETNGLHTSDEAYKMAITDALSTAMKLLGFAADVYMGGWTGSKFKDDPVPKITPDPVDKEKIFGAVVWFKDMLDDDNIDEHHEKIKAAWQRLTNNERMEVDAQLKDKAPNSNIMYKNLLKKYLDFVPSDGV